MADDKESGMSVSSIPVIELRKFGDAEDDGEEYKKLREACEEWGCFRIVNHSIPSALMLEMKTVAISLLDLPLEIKVRNTDSIAGRGYIPPNQAHPFYESFGLYNDSDSLIFQAVQTFCAQLDVSTHQRKTIEKYVEALNEVGMDIGRKIAKSVGMVDVELFNDLPWGFRMNKYNFTSESVGSTGVKTHSDSGFFTILQDDEIVSGLEVMNKCGQFVPVNPWPGTLFVNIGDVAAVWSNGKFCNVKHRVQCKETNIRVSMVLFVLGPKEVVIEAPAELVVYSKHPRLYVPFMYRDYIERRFSTKLYAGEALEFLRFK